MTYHATAAGPPPAGLLDNASLLLDFDGTLVEIAERPDFVDVDDRLRSLLKQLGEKLPGRVAIISGRPAAQVRHMLALEMTVVGSHGMEFLWRDGGEQSQSRPPALDSALTAMRSLAEQHPGTLVEEKPLGAALHYRLCPAAGPACQALAAGLADEHGLYLQAGKMMIELRAPGGDKGSALRTLMREPSMHGTRPVFMGDDVTDEPAFAAAAELGGAGVLIGAPRPSAARYRLAGVEDTLSWLSTACSQLP